MSEWKRNKRRTNGFPKGIEEGMVLEVRFRSGDVERRTVGFVEGGNLDPVNPAHFNTKDGYSCDVMAYRVVSEPAATPAINTPDYSKGFPVGTTAKDIGAKVGDEFVVVKEPYDARYEIGDTAEFSEDDRSESPFFLVNGKRRCITWSRLAPIPPKTAIELQAEEVGIPEPVQLVDADGWIEWKGGECPVPKGALIDVKYRNGHEENAIPAGEYSGAGHRMSAIDWSNNGHQCEIIAYRLHQPQEWPEDRIDVIGQNGNDGLHYTSEQLSAEADKRIDEAAQGVREAFGRKLATTEPVTAPDFLQSALNTLTQRGKDYDKPEGERSASAVAVAFNAITGRNLTEAEVWLVLQLVKDVRQWQNPERYHADSAIDCVAYAALKAEALAGGAK